ncbi:uncharacterized protein YjbI with pentapeptide repeats [Azospirillum agricola]|uniref:pentapeptide repeat-containing protein n=1 Tax=Azospirillum agricola TaxID=1720247 RepID=UPI001AE5FCD3|nr:pentapeptide repeat-containing protein [Azospirillum agricola]MBP2228631.1 uncharacterized protein YjbI with pentapeptide repeats [Azospirillum agricola]
MIAVLLGPVLWALGGWALIQETTMRALTAFRSISDPEKTVEAYGKLVGAVGLLLAAPVGLLGVGLAFWRTWNQHRDGVVAARKLEAESYAKAAEAYAKAVEQLGNEKASVRMGATLALEALGKATPRLLSQTIEILCAYVREGWSNIAPSTKEKLDNDNNFKSRIELQTAINAISRLKKHDTEDSLIVNLSMVDMKGIELIKTSLKKSSVYGSNMEIMSIIYGDFSNSFLLRVRIAGSMLSYTKFTKCNINMSCLSRSNFTECDFSESSMIGAKLEDISLYGANLTDSKLGKVVFNGVILTNANLTRADMTGATINNVKFDGAVFSDTILPNGRKWTGIGWPQDEALTSATNAPPPSLSVV